MKRIPRYDVEGVQRNSENEQVLWCRARAVADVEEANERLREAVRLLAEGLNCDECRGSDCHIVGDSTDTLEQEVCPLRTAAFNLPVVVECMKGDGRG